MPNIGPIEVAVKDLGPVRAELTAAVDLTAVWVVIGDRRHDVEYAHPALYDAIDRLARVVAEQFGVTAGPDTVTASHGATRGNRPTQKGRPR